MTTAPAYPYLGALNAVGVTRGEISVERAIKQALQDEDVVVWAVAEADDLDHGDGIPGVDLRDWQVIHRRRRGNPGIDGCAILLRKDLVRQHRPAEWHKISGAKRASRGDRGMAARYVPVVNLSISGGRAFDFGAVHLAPPRYPHLRLEGAKAVRRLRLDAWAGDLNLHPGAARRVFPSFDVRGLNDDVMNILARERFELGTAKKVRGVTASDHAAIKAAIKGWPLW